MDVVDLEAVCGIARANNVVSVVDNAFATPALQRPLEFGADVVAYSATKLMDGQGRVLAGAVTGSKAFNEDTLLAFTARKSVVQGKSVSVSVDLGGRANSTQKNQYQPI